MGISSVRLKSGLEESLESVAKKLHRSKNWVINEAVREYLEQKQQEAVRWKETLAALESVKTGRLVAGKKVHTWLESWGNNKELPPPKA